MKADLVEDANAVQLDLDDYVDLNKAGSTLIVQNLGPGDVYFDRFAEVDEEDGIKIAANGSYEFPFEKTPDLWFMASGGDADLRFSAVG